MRALVTHVGCPIAQLTLPLRVVFATGMAISHIRVQRRRAGRAAFRERGEELWVITGEAGRVESPRRLQLSVDITSRVRIQSASPLPRAAAASITRDLHNHSTVPVSLLLHEVHGELAGELNKPVVASLGHDEHALDVRPNAPATWMRHENRGARANASRASQGGGKEEEEEEGRGLWGRTATTNQAFCSSPGHRPPSPPAPS